MTRERARSGGARAARRRGITFLEVVLASALLGVIVASMTGAFSAAYQEQRIQDHRLGAAEVAHRLIVSYLDDPEAMPNDALPIAYGESLYRWEMELERPDVERGRDGFLERRSDDLGLERFRVITVTAWLSEDSGGTREPEVGTPRVTLSRVFDLFPMRNPDSLEPLVDDEEGMRRLIEIITGNSQ